jgi:hypothetical protein
MNFTQQNIPFPNTRITPPANRPMKRKISGSVPENSNPSIDESGEGSLGRIPELKTTRTVKPQAETGILSLGKNDLVRGILMSEILGKPRALKKR